MTQRREGIEDLEPKKIELRTPAKRLSLEKGKKKKEGGLEDIRGKTRTMGHSIKKRESALGARPLPPV